MRGVSDLGVDAGRPGAEFVWRESIVEAEHPFEMLGRLELGREAGTSDQLGGRVGRAQLGVLLFERLKTAQ